MYCGINVGPGGAAALVAGLVAIQASNATRNSGRNRCSAMRIADLSPAVYAVNHVLNVETSKLRSSMAESCARFAWVRVAEAFASESDDSVPHFAEA